MNRKNLILTMDSPQRFEIMIPDAVFTPLTQVPNTQNNPNPIDKHWYNYVPMSRVDLFQLDKDGFFPLCWNVKFTVPTRKNTGHFRFKVKIRQNMWLNRKLGQTKFVKVYGLEDLYQFDQNGNRLQVAGGSKPVFDRCWNLLDDSCEAISEGTHQLFGSSNTRQQMYPGGGYNAAAPGGVGVYPGVGAVAGAVAGAGAAAAAAAAGAAGFAGYQATRLASVLPTVTAAVGSGGIADYQAARVASVAPPVVPAGRPYSTTAFAGAGAPGAVLTPHGYPPQQLYPQQQDYYTQQQQQPQQPQQQQQQSPQPPAPSASNQAAADELRERVNRVVSMRSYPASQTDVTPRTRLLGDNVTPKTRESSMHRNYALRDTAFPPRGGANMD